jgi:hypothetical protein
MADEKKPLKFWIGEFSTSTSVSTSGTSESTTLMPIDPGQIVPLSDDEFKKLLSERSEADRKFARAKDEFRKVHGLEWDPRIRFTSPVAIEDSKRLLELRDNAARLVAKVLATPRK